MERIHGWCLSCIPEAWSIDQIKSWVSVRSFEWLNWPAFLSQVFAPLVVIWVPWYLVLLGLFGVGCLWCLVRYRWMNVTLSHVGDRLVWYGRWPAVLAGVLVLSYRGEYAVAAGVALWPWLWRVYSFPGDARRIEGVFKAQMGIE